LLQHKQNKTKQSFGRKLNLASFCSMTKQDWNSRKLELRSVSFTPICPKDKTRITRKLVLLLAPIEQASLR
jgi:hypothetical protein